MSDKDDDGDYRVGYKRPPRHTQYPPGKSGNRKGRKRRPRRTPSPSQRKRDVLKVREILVPVRMADGEMKLTLSEAIYFNIGKRALQDKVSWARIWLQLEGDALREEFESDQSVRLMELLRTISEEIDPDRDELTEKTLDAMLKRWRNKL